MWKKRHLAKQWLKIRRGGYRQISHVLRSADVETVNETVALVKAQALVDTGRHTSTRRDRRTWQHTSKFGGLRFSRHTGRQTSTGGGSTLNETLAQMKAHACPYSHLKAIRG